MSKRIFVMCTVLCLSSCKATEPAAVIAPETIRYVAVGDSLTSGHGVLPSEAWSALLVDHAISDGNDIVLVENLAVSGKTTAEALAEQLPLFRELEPNFATLLIGANDLFASRPVGEFYLDYIALLDGMLDVVPANRLIVMTIPDYTRTPLGFLYGNKKDFKKRITAYNDFIREQAKIRNVAVVDMHKQSKWVMFDVGLLAEDGIHPSARGHEKWEEVIYPVASKLLR